MTVTAKLVFKKRLFLSRELDNQMERELVFHQTVTDLLMGVLPCAEEEVVALAALKLQVTFLPSLSSFLSSPYSARWIPKWSASFTGVFSYSSFCFST